MINCFIIKVFSTLSIFVTRFTFSFISVSTFTIPILDGQSFLTVMLDIMWHNGFRLYEVRNLKGQSLQLLLNETKPFFLLLTYEKYAKEKWLCE